MRRQLVLIVVPIKTVGVVNHAVSNRIGHLAGVRIDAIEPFTLVINEEFVFLTSFCSRYVDVPIAVAFMFQRMSAFVPQVEVACDC